MNSVELVGNLTRDPELRYTKENYPVCSFTLAINRPTEGVDYIDISVWNKQAENCKKYLVKGRKVAIEGSIRTGIYEKDDKKYKTFNVLANKVYFLSSNQQDANVQVKEKQPAEDKENASYTEDDAYSLFEDSIEYDVEPF